MSAHEATSKIKESVEFFSVSKFRKCVVLRCNGVVTYDDCNSQSLKSSIMKQLEIVSPENAVETGKVVYKMLGGGDTNSCEFCLHLFNPCVWLMLDNTNTSAYCQEDW